MMNLNRAGLLLCLSFWGSAQAASNTVEIVGTDDTMDYSINMGFQLVSSLESINLPDVENQEPMVDHALENGFSAFVEAQLDIMPQFSVGTELFYMDYGAEGSAAVGLDPEKSFSILAVPTCVNDHKECTLKSLSKFPFPQPTNTSALIKYKGFGLRVKPMYKPWSTFYLSPVLGFALNSAQQTSNLLFDFSAKTLAYSWDWQLGFETGLLISDHWLLKAGYQFSKPKFNLGQYANPIEDDSDGTRVTLHTPHQMQSIYLGLAYQF